MIPPSRLIRRGLQPRQRGAFYALAAAICALGLSAGCSPLRTSGARANSPAAVEARVRELKLELPTPPPMPATIRPVVVVGRLAFVSGHISRAADGTVITGRVGEELDVAAGRHAARRCGLAILSSLRAELGSLNRVRRVVKVLGLVNCPPGFKDQPAVINGCSELFIEVFGQDHGTGARSAVGASALPNHVAVEIEAIFELAD